MFLTHLPFVTVKSLGLFLILGTMAEALMTLSILVGDTSCGSWIVAGGTDILVRLAGALKNKER